MLRALLLAASLSCLAGAASAQNTRADFIIEHDQNRDGAVTRAEYMAAREARLAAMDADRDGAEQAEFVAEYRARLEAQLSRSSAPPQEKARARMDLLEQAGNRFRVIDTDKDGKLTVQEYAASADFTWNEQDRNKDGVVNAADAAPAPRAS